MSVSMCMFVYVCIYVWHTEISFKDPEALKSPKIPDSPRGGVLCALGVRALQMGSPWGA